MAEVPVYSASSLLNEDQAVAKKEKAKTTARGKMMRKQMISGKKESLGSSFSRRPQAPLSGNDEEEKDEDEEQDDEEEEGEEDEGRKGWSE